MAGEDPVDIYPEIRKGCESKCAPVVKEYNACLDRVAGKGGCDGQYFDLLKCVDKCAAPQIFKHLK
ncbi:hypothetical protein SDRG_01280 [Saprolegnia diclina VS20]|uniref:Ubiquinol-cytochrome C reductase hinge domain-containing protein n=2 Tax=Saprolegnia TaxID=4769 RepID=A0A067CW65_SAPPC|nr:hypothetical protein SDRG_01280 [Saprolegnia diclina VS20]XP_012194613.1 hypothetical protein SPRG_01021 [Saprolegnia parasitica CBS 223.65]EQC41305.1 hypothetical protein SDRG_01280 [Saprolegnia diclina VS20]KDO34959.1 hypothetical protein SPRG_01021 [Saprolegnia parasitica CBS 223.65]|eukprot:XP_008605019.1 hypothetical protein SDRG_01280 [Saprolegnia diclina VS20]